MGVATLPLSVLQHTNNSNSYIHTNDQIEEIVMKLNGRTVESRVT